MAYQLVVKHPFLTFAIGDHITDPNLVASYGAQYPEYVVKKLYEDASTFQASTPPNSTASLTVPATPAVPVLKPIV